MRAQTSTSKFLWSLLGSLLLASGCSKPAKIEVSPERLVLEGAGQTAKLEAKVYDDSGDLMPEAKVVWFSDDNGIIKLDPDGNVTSLASGEATIEVELVSSDLKTEVPVRVKIPSSIKTSHERLRLWKGQVKGDVWAEVHSEKGAFIEGYMPEWLTDDPNVVTVEAIKVPERRQSWVKLVGVNPGVTFIKARFKNISESIRVAVYDEDQEYAPDGTPLPPKDSDE